MLAADGSCRSRSCCDRDSVCKVSVLDVKWGLGCGVAAGHHRVPKKRYLCREGLPVSCSPRSWPPPSPDTTALSSFASLASLIHLSVQDAPKLQGRRKKMAKWDQRGREAHTQCTEQHQATT